MKVARMIVSLDLLRECLHLPMATEIRSIGMRGTAVWPLEAELVVEHPDLQDVTIAEGEQPPLITPTFRRNVEVELIDWGQK